MTTILADFHRRVIVADTLVTSDARAWQERKVFRIRGMLVTHAGDVGERSEFLEWLKHHPQDPPSFKWTESDALVMDAEGLWVFRNESIRLTKVPRGIEAIGSGGMGAICAYEALGFSDPVQAVKIACKHDPGSRVPVRAYRLTTA